MRLATFRSIDALTVVGGNVFFEADDGVHGLELWTSDGTEAGTRLVRDVAPGPASSSPSALAAVGDRLLFAADDGAHGIEPWVSDGSEEGTRLLEDVLPGPPSSHPGQFEPSGAVVYFEPATTRRGRRCGRFLRVRSRRRRANTRALRASSHRAIERQTY